MASRAWRRPPVWISKIYGFTVSDYLEVGVMKIYLAISAGTVETEKPHDGILRI